METTDQKPELQKVKNNILEKRAIVTGIIMSICYIAYFLIMESLGLATVPEYRIVNFLIQFIAVATSIKLFKSASNGRFTYLEGFALGCLSSFISVILFALFIYAYLSKINPELLPSLMNKAEMMGKYLTPFSAALAVAVEGSIAGLIISFTLMQFFKDDALHNPLKKKSNEME